LQELVAQNYHADAAHYEVAPLDDRTAKAYVERHLYSARVAPF
jgi:hypothetical protein